MPRFIKLTNLLLNTNDIHRILISPNKYHIYIMCKKFEGSNFNIGPFGLGNISSYTTEIEVCETNHSVDYKIVSDWIKRYE